MFFSRSRICAQIYRVMWRRGRAAFLAWHSWIVPMVNNARKIFTTTAPRWAARKIWHPTRQSTHIFTLSKYIQIYFHRYSRHASLRVFVHICAYVCLLDAIYIGFESLSFPFFCQNIFSHFSWEGHKGYSCTRKHTRAIVQMSTAMLSLTTTATPHAHTPKVCKPAPLIKHNDMLFRCPFYASYLIFSCSFFYLFVPTVKDMIPIDPSSPEQYPVLEDVFGEVLPQFIDDYVHIGGKWEIEEKVRKRESDNNARMRERSGAWGCVWRGAASVHRRLRANYGKERKWEIEKKETV